MNCEKGEYHYSETIDGTKRAFGQLEYIPIEKRVRDVKAQAAAGGDYRKETDQGGHLIGAQFGGLSIRENLFPQNANLNQGAYKSLELEWARLLKDNNKVYVDINISSATGTRQDSIYGSYTVIKPDGSFYSDYFSFANEDRKEQEMWEKSLL